jgi:hypothetical protein
LDLTVNSNSVVEDLLEMSLQAAAKHLGTRTGASSGEGIEMSILSESGSRAAGAF